MAAENGLPQVPDAREPPVPSLTPGQGEMLVHSFGSVVTAQKVAVARDHAKILQKLKMLCAMAGDKYVYSWPTQDRENKRETMVEGPTIKLANDLAREFGNCVVDIRAFDQSDHILFYARFTDLETGYSMTRPFQQRKSQSIGMRDRRRAADLVFQIGASKAIRNVIVNALSTYSDFMVDEAKKGMLDWIESHGPKANQYIDNMMAEFQIAQKRIEAVIGRKRADWNVRDIARVLAELHGLEDGFMGPDDLYPSAEKAAEIEAAKAAKKDEKPEGEQSAASASGDQGAKGNGGEPTGAKPKPAPKPRTTRKAAAPKETPPAADEKPAAAAPPKPTEQPKPTAAEPARVDLFPEE
jgi:pyruvate/2-oxoglutarate dehydrogenase complex dihydrolipoamide acyltransferase (E2) component